MKNFKKAISFLGVFLCLIFFLAGCASNNRLIATKILTEEEDNLEGKRTYEILFESDKIVEVKMSITFENEDDLDTYYNMLELYNTMLSEDEKKLEIQKEDKKIETTLNAEQFEKMTKDGSKDITKKELKEKLEGKGYKVK